ncbi:hypothetical protein BKA93DRAFT_112174 [Sparassis latifolia]
MNEPCPQVRERDGHLCAVERLHHLGVISGYTGKSILVHAAHIIHCLVCIFDDTDTTSKLSSLATLEILTCYTDPPEDFPQHIDAPDTDGTHVLRHVCRNGVPRRPPHRTSTPTRSITTSSSSPRPPRPSYSAITRRGISHSPIRGIWRSMLRYVASSMRSGPGRCSTER